MDAITTKKTMSIGLVALLVVSSLVALGPAVAQIPNPSGSGVATAVVNAGLTHTATTGVQDPGITVSNTTHPSGGIQFGTSYDITFTNVTGSVDEPFALRRHGDSTIVGNTRLAASDIEHGGQVNVTFPSFSFNTVGLWYMNSTTTSTSVVFVVNAQENLQVTLSQTSFTFTETAVSFTITVTNLTAGNVGAPVPNITLSGPGIPSGSTTDSNGQYVYFGPLPAVGTHTINATRDTDSDGLAEFSGSATFTVNAATLQVVALNTSVLHGFAAWAAWNISYPTNTTGIMRDGEFFSRANLSVTLPNGTVVSWNGTGTPDPTPALTFRNTTEGGLTFDPTNVVFGFDNRGNFSFRPAASWPAGTYSFNLAVNTRGTAAEMQFSEYTATWSLSTSAPQAVNVAVRVSGADVTALPVLPATSAGSTGITAGAYSIDLFIEGDVLGQFPGTAAWHAFSSSNVTVSGDVLPGYTVGTPNTGTGITTITGIVPTSVGGTVNFHIAWKNSTTTISVPISATELNPRGGAKSAASVEETIVDQTTTVTVTIRDSFDNLVPNAQVFFMREQTGVYPGLGVMSINGTGAPNLGQNGQYTVSVRPTEVGNLTVYAITGSDIGGIDNRNYTYVSIRVAPAHDLQVTLTANTTMASNTTYVHINATTPDGVGVPAGSYRVYFLTETQHNNLIANGTSALPAFPQTSGGNGTNVAISGASATGINANVTLGPGTFYVYVCSQFTSDCTSAKHDNLGNTPMFTSTRYNATFSPARIADQRDIQSETTVNVTITDAEGNPVNGTLMLDNTVFLGRELNTTGTGTNLSNVAVVDGQASFLATGAMVGDVWFAFNPAGGHSTHASRVSQAFQVVGADVTVTPTTIPVGQVTPVTIVVRSLDGGFLANKAVRICGGPIGGPATAPAIIDGNATGCTGEAMTDANGTARLGVLPTSTGTLYLYVNNTRTTTTIPVVAGLAIRVEPSSPEAGDTVTLTVSQPGRAGESGVSVNVTRDGQSVLTQTTGSSGQIVLSDVQQGNYTVTASKAGFETATETFTVGAADETPVDAARFSLHNLDVPTAGTVGAGLTASADIRNTGTADGTATVLLLVNGAVRGSQNVPVAAGEEESVAFDFTPNTVGTYRVTIRLAGGETLAERTVTVTTPTTPTPPVTPTPPTTPSPTPTTPDEPGGVPGFTLLALIGALGVALVVLRGRRN